MINIYFTNRFKKSHKSAPKNVQKAFKKQIRYLSEDLRHPSLYAKKYDESLNMWQVRVNRSWRMYFVIDENTYYLVDMTEHPK